MQGVSLPAALAKAGPPPWAATSLESSGGINTAVWQRARGRRRRLWPCPGPRPWAAGTSTRMQRDWPDPGRITCAAVSTDNRALPPAAWAGLSWACIGLGLE